MARSHFGICHICGKEGKLSFEHVPPEAAFNSTRIIWTAFERLIENENLDKLRGSIQQRGAGAYTLCEPCNNTTGHWYGPAYVAWAKQAMKLLMLTGGRASLAYPFNIYPLRVMKQIVCMFFSVNNAHFQERQKDLVRFVLNRDSREFPSTIKIYAFYTFTNRSRSIGATGMIRGLGTGNSSTHLLSEITFAPFGFVMTLGNTAPPVPGLPEITGFSNFAYSDWRAGISMKLPIMPIYTGIPADYRLRDQVLADRAASAADDAALDTFVAQRPG
jgi:hypothetical protein